MIIDCCTREIVGWTLDLRTRSTEAIACVEAALLARGIRPGTLTIGTDNGSQFTSRDFRRRLSARGVKHRRGRLPRPRVPGLHRVLVRPVQEALRLARRMGDHRHARSEITTYIDTYHHRPHSGIGYRTPAEVAQTWRTLQTRAT